MSISYLDIAKLVKLYWRPFLYKFIKVYFTINKYIIIFFAIRLTLVYFTSSVLFNKNYTEILENNSVLTGLTRYTELFFPITMVFVKDFAMPDFSNFNFILRNPVWYFVEHISRLVILWVWFTLNNSILNINSILRDADVRTLSAYNAYTKFMKNLIIFVGFKNTIEYLGFLIFIIINIQVNSADNYGASPFDLGFILLSVPYFAILLFVGNIYLSKWYRAKVDKFESVDQSIPTQPVVTQDVPDQIVGETVNPLDQNNIPFDY